MEPSKNPSHWMKFRTQINDIFVERGRVVSGAVLAERGRLMAARQVARDPEARRRVEDIYGVDIARQTYPEAYKAKSIVDRLKDLIGL